MQLVQWQLWFCENKTKKEYKNIDELEKSGIEHFPVDVPCNFEGELQKNGHLEDLYYSDNVFMAQKYEYFDQWYSVKFNCDLSNPEIRFKGIDTVADIYFNGSLLASVDNMFIEYAFPLKDAKKTDNEIVIHIYPVMEVAKRYEIGAGSFSHIYNSSSLHIRKSPCVFGWDIFPRLLGGGIWRDVEIVERKNSFFEDVYLYTCNISDSSARLNLYFRYQCEEIDASNCVVEVCGKCGNSEFSYSRKAWHTENNLRFCVDNPRLWWPKYEGEQNLYNVRVRLKYGERVLDERKFRFGIRTIKNIHTETASNNGKFEFHVNGRKVFITGYNWVPLDALESNGESRLKKALELVEESGVNMVRVWGGGYYESDAFYSWCDEHGILVWQDFMMGCAIYPEDEDFCKQISKEVSHIVKKLRQYSCIALWAGDNENDCAHFWNGFSRNPNGYRINRLVVADMVRIHDPVRDYLPSSPYMSPSGWEDWDVPEMHIWHQDLYFKDKSLQKNPYKFVSETGYLSLPSEKSLRQFLREPDRWVKENGKCTAEYLAHLTCMDANDDTFYNFRMDSICKHTEMLLGRKAKNLTEFVQSNQICQAEALKFFVERMRIRRNETGGIIIWNLLDGYTEITDAVVDYYFRKKLSFYYLKRSEKHLCLMFDEPNPNLDLYCVNDLPNEVYLKYTVKDLHSGKIVLSGVTKIASQQSVKIAEITEKEIGDAFYLIEWETSEHEKGVNHFCTKLKNIDLKQYLSDMKKAGFEDFE